MKRHPGREWQLQEAKARFSEHFRLARASGPHRVTKHGQQGVVVIAAETFDQLTESKSRKGTLVEFFANSPLAEFGIEFERRPDYGRDIDL